jgi:hypothetical protein
MVLIDLLEIGWTFQAPSPPCSSAGERVGVRGYNPAYYALINRSPIKNVHAQTCVIGKVMRD